MESEVTQKSPKSGAYIQKNQVWIFPVDETHTVQIGDYLNCTCYKHCSELKKIIRRLWHLEENFDLGVYHFMNPSESNLPPIKCYICYDETNWNRRGLEFTCCRECYQPYHRSCLDSWMIVKDQCPHCRAGPKFSIHEFDIPKNLSQSMDIVTDTKVPLQTRIHKGVLQFPEGRTKLAAQYLWKISEVNQQEIPAIVPYECNDDLGACVQWGSKIITYILLEGECVVIEVDKSGDISQFTFPKECDELEKFIFS